MKGNKGASISISFVFISETGKQDDKMKKIIFPSNYSSLLKSCNHLFKDKFIVRSIYTSDGNLVRKIEDVTPGSILIVSPKEADQIGNENIPNNAKLFQENDLQQMKKTKLNNKKEKNTAGYHNLFGTNSKNQNKITYDYIDSDVSDDELNPNDNSQKNALNQSKDQNSQTSGLKRKLSNLQSDTSDLSSSKRKNKYDVDSYKNKRNYDYYNEKYFEAHQNKSKHHKHSKKSNSNMFLNDADGSYGDYDYTEYNSEDVCNRKIGINDEEEEEEEANMEGEDKMEYDDSSLKIIATEILNEESFSNHIQKAFQTFDEGTIKFLEVGQTLEDAQRNWWFLRSHKLLESQSIGSHGNYMFAYDEMTSFVKDIIVKHRFIESSTISSIKMRMAICGPRKSGKSTILSLLADTLLIETAVDGSWKNTIFYFVNMNDMAPFCTDFKQIYVYMADLCLKSLSMQKPDLASHYPMLLKYFSSIFIYQNAPKLQKLFSNNPQYKNFAVNCENLAKLYFKLWMNPDTHIPFLIFTFQFPSLLAQAAGYKNIFLFIDNYEFSNITISDDIDNSQEYNIHEAVSILLDRANYVISCEDQKAMFPLLDDKTELIGTFQLKAQTKYDKAQLHVNFEFQYDNHVENDRVVITSSHCGEIPAFISIWEDINAVADEVDEKRKEAENKENSINDSEDTVFQDDKAEMEEALFSLVQHFVQDMISEHQGEKLKVVSVHRTNK